MNIMSLEIFSEMHEFERKMLFDFSSDTKRMTVVLKYHQMYFMYTKGADEIMMPLMY